MKPTNSIQPDLFGSNATPPAIIQSMTNRSMESALHAYRNNIALPDVHVADRHDQTQPKVIGEDGQPMTFERRQELMKGKTPMCKMVGDRAVVVPGLDYRQQFDGQIETEPLGKSACENRPGMRVVQPRELDTLGAVDMHGAEGTWIPGVEDAMRNENRCLYSCPGVRTAKRLIDAIIQCTNVIHEQRLPVRFITMSEEGYRCIRQGLLMDEPHFAPSEQAISMWGSPVRINNAHGAKISLDTDDGYYAAIFIEPPLLFDLGYDPSADTSVMLSAMDVLKEEVANDDPC